MAAVVAAPDPDMAPKKAQLPTVVMPRLPRTPPTRDKTQLTMRLDRPPRLISSPAKMKKGAARKASVPTLENIFKCVIVIVMSKKKTRATNDVVIKIK